MDLSQTIPCGFPIIMGCFAGRKNIYCLRCNILFLTNFINELITSENAEFFVTIPMTPYTIQDIIMQSIVSIKLLYPIALIIIHTAIILKHPKSVLTIDLYDNFIST